MTPLTFYCTCMHLANAFVQRDLQRIQDKHSFKNKYVFHAIRTRDLGTANPMLHQLIYRNNWEISIQCRLKRTVKGKQWDNEGADGVVCVRVESTQLEDVITTRPLSVLQWSAGSQRAELEEVLGYSPSLSRSLWKCGGLGTAAASGAGMHAHTQS